MSLVSGNTFGAELWSDNKFIAPSLPQISLIQKCPHCGKYFSKERQEARYAKKGWSSEQGFLTFPEMKEAFQQFTTDGFLNEREESEIRLMLFHSYNDFYHRSEEHHDIARDDYELFISQGKWLIEHFVTDNILKAEYYREIGDFETAQALLSSVSADDDVMRKIVQSIKEKIRVRDAKVFRIK